MRATLRYHLSLFRKKIFALDKITILCLCGICILIQYFYGSIPIRIFAFPLNMILACGLIYFLWIFRQRKEAKKWGSLSTTFIVLGILVINGLLLGFIPQLSTWDALTRYPLFYRFGLYQYTSSWLFNGSLLLLLWVLGTITFQRIRTLNRRNILFFLSHGGLWIAVFAATFGSADTYKAKFMVTPLQSTRTGFESDGTPFHLPYSLKLNHFSVLHQDQHDNGKRIQNYQATLEISQQTQIDTVTVSINHPVTYDGDRIYLSAYEHRSTPYCTILIVRQPWARMIFWGILFMLAGAFYLFISGFKLKHKDHGME